jgi:hypothetical protein
LIRRPDLSIVVPVHDEEGNVGPLHGELTGVGRGLGGSYELIFVNDGSTDRTLERLDALMALDPHLRVVDLDGNFGEAAALSAGFEAARGRVVVTLDGDGQNDPADIPKLLARLAEGYDAVSGRRIRRTEDFGTRVLPSLVANRLIALVTGVPVYDCGCGLKAYRRELLAGVQLPRGMHRFLPAILGADAARVAEVETRDRPRGSGASHYGLSRLLIVLRDLPSLPLLVRRPPPGQKDARMLGAGATLLLGLAVADPWSGGRALGVLLAAAAAGTAAVAYNVARFARARAHGVFRVRRIVHASQPAEPPPSHRDRGSRVLGR